MAFNIPKLPEQDGIGKVSSFIQFALFLVMFVGIYLLLRKLVHATLLRILILVLDYFVVSLITYVVIRPLAMRAEAAFRKRK
ncbi:MAG: hypothetical protein K5705_00900 [Oscillospiraceae bacterium]|nr:hypothetical protein [Oscillospiraceae bacterium]